MKWTARGVTAVVAIAVATAVSGPVAQANTGGLGLPGFGAILVDQAHKHVFISGGPTSNTVVVTDFWGDVVKRIDGQSGATGLALSADGASVYVALAAGDAVSVLDTAKLAETSRIATAAQTCPTSLTRTGQYLWFGYSCGQTWDGGVGRVDTAATPPAVLNNQTPDTPFQGAPLVVSPPAEAGPVVAAQPGLSLSTTAVYSVSAGALHAGASGTAAGSNLADVAVTPDGSILYTAAGSQNAVSGYATADLASRGAYSTGHYPNAVAGSTDGQYLAAGVFSADHKVLVYKVGGTTPVRTVGLSGHTTAARGLAFSADAKKLFVVTDGPALTVVDDPTEGCDLLC